MIDGAPDALALVAAVGAGVVGGVFFTFSVFVMQALAALPAPQGIAAMQSVNRKAITPWFMAALFGTALVCVALMVTAVVDPDEPGTWLRLAGGASYLVVIVLTASYHVPRNNALAAVDPNDRDAVTFWTRYVSEWTAWNHVRAIAAVAGSVLCILAIAAD